MTRKTKQSTWSRRKAPGHDGIPHDFFINMWETIQQEMPTVMNQMYMDGTILEPQKHGIIVCVPKKAET
jgi:hypothetical protein